MTFINNFKRLHKWLALLVGIQLLLWVISGIVFSFIDHRVVNGGFIYGDNQKPQITELEDFSKILARYPTATEISQYVLLGQPLFKVVVGEDVKVIDAKSLEDLVIDKALIEQIAEKNYIGGGRLVEAILVSEINDDNRRFNLPSWQINFDDEFETHLYFSAKTGQYQGVSTNSWRTFDFFMMLHFMDYGQRGDFNHWLIIFAAIVLLFFSMSGMLLVYSSFSRKDFVMLINRFYQHKKFTVTLVTENGEKKKLKIDRDVRLMDALSDQNIELDSVCGGGGICGFCRVKLINADKDVLLDHLGDHDTLNDEELKQGYRLACQLSVDSNIEIEVPAEVLS